MIEFVYQAPWLNNEGDYIFFLLDISIHEGHGRIAFGAFGFLLGVIFHTS